MHTHVVSYPTLCLLRNFSFFSTAVPSVLGRAVLPNVHIRLSFGSTPAVRLVAAVRGNAQGSCFPCSLALLVLKDRTALMASSKKTHSLLAPANGLLRLGQPCPLAPPCTPLHPFGPTPVLLHPLSSAHTQYIHVDAAIHHSLVFFHVCVSTVNQPPPSPCSLILPTSNSKHS